jgi:cytosine/adenosine deaminase-related metal-dependent hydrolase
MVLRNLLIQGREGHQDILVENGQISAIGPGSLTPGVSGPEIRFSGAQAVPGLINSHDHLDFNLFPPLAHGVYANYREWGRDIHDRDRDLIQKVMKVPRGLRTAWGLYKNLLGGVTTVIHHGPRLDVPEGLIRVWQKPRSLHSIGFEKNWRYKLNLPFDRRQVVIHGGEGTDLSAHRELDALGRWNLLGKKVVVVHGVAMEQPQARHFQAMVWCPASNLFLLDRTADVFSLKSSLSVLFGTDSCLTAPWDIWEQIRLARGQGQLDDMELLEALGPLAAAVWGMEDRGKLAPGKRADILVTENCGPDGKFDIEAFFSTRPENILLLVSGGKILLMDEKVRQDSMGEECGEGFGQVVGINGHSKWVAGDLRNLAAEIRHHLPEMVLPFSPHPHQPIKPSLSRFTGIN